MFHLSSRTGRLLAIFMIAGGLLLAACDNTSTTSSSGAPAAPITTRVGTLTAGSWLIIREDANGTTQEMIEVNVGLAGAQCGLTIIGTGSSGTCSNFMGNTITITAGGVGSQTATVDAPVIEGSKWTYMVHKK